MTAPNSPEQKAPGTGQRSPIVFETVYRSEFSKLRSMAKRLLSGERAGHTLQPTALVHESFLKLRAMQGRIESNEHFFYLSARAMRQVLVDHARVRGKWIRVEPESLAELFHALWRSKLDVDLALDLKVTFERLRVIDPMAAQVIWLHYSEGRTIDETSAFLGRSLARVRTDMEFGLKWMADQLRNES